MKNDTNYKFGQTMHSVKRILTTENQTCAIRPTAIQSSSHDVRKYFIMSMEDLPIQCAYETD